MGTIGGLKTISNVTTDTNVLLLHRQEGITSIFRGIVSSQKAWRIT